MYDDDDYEAPEDERDFWPLGRVAFTATAPELVMSAEELYKEAWHAQRMPERAEILRATAAWYLDLAHDLDAIQALPEVAVTR